MLARLAFEDATIAKSLRLKIVPSLNIDVGLMEDAPQRAGRNLVSL